MNSGGYIPRRQRIYQVRWIKNDASLMATISSSETFAKQRAIFLSARKTVNNQGYSELREPIKTLSTDLVNINNNYYVTIRVRVNNN